MWRQAAWKSSGKNSRRCPFWGDVWDQASDDGVNLDCLSHAALFQAISSLVLAHGEEAVAEFCGSLSSRILCGDYSLDRQLQ